MTISTELTPSCPGLFLLPFVFPEGSNVWEGRGYDDFVPGEVTKTAPSGDRTT